MTELVKRSLSIRGHRTSVSLEKPFYDALQEIAAERGRSLAALIAAVDERRPAGSNLSSALRLHVLEYYRGRVGTSVGDGAETPRESR